MLAKPRERQQIMLGNASLRGCCRILAACIDQRVPAIAENPHTALSWQYPPMARLCAAPSATRYVADYCQFRMPWRKRTRLVGWHTGTCAALQARCTCSRGLCSASGRPHLHLQGTSGGRNLTRMAEAYPLGFAKAVAALLVRAADRGHLQHLWSLVR